jgi:hypothetical protein
MTLAGRSFRSDELGKLRQRAESVRDRGPGHLGVSLSHLEQRAGMDRPAGSR